MLNKRILAFLLTVIISLGIIGVTTPDIVKNVRLGLDLKGGFEILYEAEPLEGTGTVTKEALQQTARSLQQRIDQMGTDEPEIYPEGQDRIRVRIPGIEDEAEVREILKKPAELTFRAPDGTVELRGNDFVEGAAQVGFDQVGQPIIQIEVKDHEKWRDVSERLLGQQLSIYLDDQLLSAPVVQGIFTDGKATISGNFTYDEAKELADTINLGALPLKLTEVYTQSVGATLGQMSLQQTLIAGIIASIFIFLFMVGFYRIPGIIASIVLVIYTWALLLVYTMLNATLTLPGIAAFILGVGMAVDANIITAERLKDELRSGKSLVSALRSGQKHSIRAIMDANITTIIAAAVLFYLGSGAIRGFALTLILSIILSILTNVLLAQWLLQLLLKSNVFKNTVLFGVRKDQITPLAKSDTKEKNKPYTGFDFVGKRKWFFSFSGAVTALGLISLLMFNLNLGVDFKAGTTLDISLSQSITKSEADQVLADADFEGNITVGGTQQDRVTIRFDRVLSADAGETKQIVDAFAAYTGGEVSYEENTVDPMIARELAQKAIIAVAVACIGIIIYVTVRFEWRFALASVIALIHNAFFVISIFSIFQLEVDLTFIAAILTIIGYTINDTIVIFDRIRENLRFAKLKNFQDVSDLVNRSIRQMLIRSINTGVNVIFASIALLIWGSESIRMFSLAMTIGLFIGMYTSIFIASPLWVLMKTRSLHKKPKVKPQADGEPAV